MADTTKTTSADALGLDAQAEMLKTERRVNNVWNKLKRNKTAMIGLVIVVVMVFIAVFAPVLAPYDPDEIHPLDAFLKPFSEGHIFGTDQFGRDLLSRVIYGARVSLIVAAGGTDVYKRQVVPLAAGVSSRSNSSITCLNNMVNCLLRYKMVYGIFAHYHQFIAKCDMGQ